jgi:site-specific DNA-methyltransferase (cytosine-N4-specific)
MPHGNAVLDPFCGSGTTLTEAQRLGLPSVGIDVNPIACLISRVKTAPTPLNLDRVAATIAGAARNNRDPKRWDIPNVDHWFKPEVQVAIAALVQEIGTGQAGECNDALRLALSSILVRVSNQESDTRYAAIDKPFRKADVFDHFLTACRKIGKALSTRDWQPLPRPRLIEADTMKVEPGAIGMPVGMVITSPPYPNAYEYWLYHKYRMWWLGFDPLVVKSQEIGARAHFFKREHHTEQNFKDQMRRVFALVDAVLVPRGFACFVIGRSKIHGHIIDNSDIIRAVAEEQGMNLISCFERVISANRKSFNLSHAKIKTETVIVMQKE